MKSGHIKILRLNEGLTVFKPDYYLNRGKKAISDLLDRGITNSSLADLTDKLYQGGIFKRVFVETEENAHQYITASDMVKTQPLDTAKNISIKYTPWVDEMTLWDKQILVSCAGTVGNTALVNDSFSGCIGSQEIIRIETNKIPYGFLYAYLSAPIVNEYIQSMIYGAVVPRISPRELGRLPVLLPEEPKQQQIHNLIVEASKLRVEANKLLEEANNKFHSLNEIEYSNYHLSVSENKEYLGFVYKISDTSRISIKAKNHSKRILEIKRIWNSKNGVLLKDFLVNDFKIGSRGNFKRIDSEIIGAEMVSQGDLHRINPKNYKRVIISRKNIDDFGNENLVLFPAVGNGSSEGEILFRPTLSYKSFNDKLLSGDIGKFQCPSLKHAAYLLVALKSKGGFRMMRAFYYGTQLRRPNWELLKGVNIPIKDEECFNIISSLAIEAYDLRFKADEKENQAINLIENEIEQWQTS